MRFYLLLPFILLSVFIQAQQPAANVNVFLGSSGDHGQLSPAASYPFSTLSIGPQTYPNLHMGYEHKAKVFLGFTHNRVEGVGCMGSGGNLLIKPFVGGDPANCQLLKAGEKAGPGYYTVNFDNGIGAAFTVYERSGVEQYTFPAGRKGWWIDLSHTLANRFVNEEHQIKGNRITGWIDSKTTCNVGVYRVYYCLDINAGALNITDQGEHHLLLIPSDTTRSATIRVDFSSVDEAHAVAALPAGTLNEVQHKSTQGWNELLQRIQVKGPADRIKLFYSLLYRTVQSPYIVSEKDGAYRAVDGSLQHTKDTVYNGWAIWDNYRTQLPLLSILFPERYGQMAASIAGLYKHGKKDYATQHEPSNTVRTEHAIVVLLDAVRKGYPVDVRAIKDSLLAEAARLDFAHPDKALESSYDVWALSELMNMAGDKTLSDSFKRKALEYKTYWNRDFKDLTKNDVDRVSARGMYQGTVWQYRWLVPFDVKGLIELTGGMEAYVLQLDQFFDNDLYCHANEPDIQAPFMYNMTPQPWKSQALAHKYAVDTVVQYYFNDNSRGIDPFVDVIYRNSADTYVRTMDDDAGAMSAWYVFTACGLSPACVGWPVYYLNAPLLPEISFKWGNGKSFVIRTENFTTRNRYISRALLNGKPLNRNWLTHEEIMKGGVLTITASDKPVPSFGTTNQWITSLGE